MKRMGILPIRGSNTRNTDSLETEKKKFGIRSEYADQPLVWGGGTQAYMQTGQDISYTDTVHRHTHINMSRYRPTHVSLN